MCCSAYPFYASYVLGHLAAFETRFTDHILLQARRVFQNDVLGQIVENPLYQEHLALNPGQHVQSQ